MSQQQSQPGRRKWVDELFETRSLIREALAELRQSNHQFHKPVLSGRGGPSAAGTAHAATLDFRDLIEPVAYSNTVQSNDRDDGDSDDDDDNNNRIVEVWQRVDLGEVLYPVSDPKAEQALEKSRAGSDSGLRPASEIGQRVKYERVRVQGLEALDEFSMHEVAHWKDGANLLNGQLLEPTVSKAYMPPLVAENAYRQLNTLLADVGVIPKHVNQGDAEMKYDDLIE